MYTRIYDKFFESKDILSLPYEIRFTYLYFLAGKHRNIIGLYKMPLNYVSADLYLSIAEVKNHIVELCKKGLIKYDAKQEIILIKKFLIYNKIDNPNQAKKAYGRLIELPQTELLEDFKEIVFSLDLTEGKMKQFQKAFDLIEKRQKETVPKPFENPFECLCETVMVTVPQTVMVTVPQTLEKNNIEGLGEQEKEEEEERRKKKEEEKKPQDLFNPNICQKKKRKIPYDKIVENYNKILTPELPKINKLTDKRKRAIKKLCEEVPEFNTLSAFVSYFKIVKKDDFLMGRTPRDEKHKNWIPSFCFLLEVDRVVDLVEKFKHKQKHINNSNGNGHKKPEVIDYTELRLKKEMEGIKSNG